MNKLSKEKKLQLALVAMATLGVIAGLWLGLLSLQKKKLKEISSKITSTQQQIEKVQKVMVEAGQIEAALNESATNLSAIEATMPSGVPLFLDGQHPEAVQRAHLQGGLAADRRPGRQ